MEQQQFKISLSVGTKLLTMGVLLLVAVITFLSVSAVILLTEDKKAYVYQSQATEAVLAGREFVSTTRRVIDVLRLTLASVDPSRPATPAELSAFRSIVENQSDVAHVSYEMVDTRTGAHRTLVAGGGKANAGFRSELNAADYKALSAELLENSYAFVNLSKLGEQAVYGVLVADKKAVTKEGGLPVAVGIVLLKDFVREMNGLNLTIVTKTGRVLYDADPTIMYGTRNVDGDPLFETAWESQIAAGATEYEVGENSYLGSYVQAGLDLIVLNKIDRRKAMRAAYTLTEKLLLLGTMSVAMAVVLMLVFAKTLTRPINRLYQATKEVAKGNFSVSLPASGKDEIGALTSSFTAMSAQISGLIQERMDKVRMENDLAIASTVQQNLIPPAAFESERLRIFSHYKSANECGGDWWGFFGVGNKISVMIADATGHGLPCALITASARSCVSMLHKLAQEDPDFSFSPAAMLSYANRVVYDASLGRIMMTFFVATIDLDTMTLTYSNAGHNPVWLFRKENEALKSQSLVVAGPRLGEQRDYYEFQEKTVPIQVGDQVFLYTDGLIEGKNPEGAMYGKKRPRKLIEDSFVQGPEKVVHAVIEDFLAFNTPAKPFDDDLTVAVVEILGQKAGAQAHA